MQRLRGALRPLFAGTMNHAAIKRLLLFCCVMQFAPATPADDMYQAPDAFIKEVFADQQAETRVIWLDKGLQQKIAAILDHPYRGLRIRYWMHAGRSAWILDEIGKEKPITTGIVINHNRIERVRILAFRESRGWEVKHAFFTRQFENAALAENTQLDHDIDNISGATLSVRAVTKLARIALLLHQQVTTDGAS